MCLSKFITSLAMMMRLNKSMAEKDKRWDFDLIVLGMGMGSISYRV